MPKTLEFPHARIAAVHAKFLEDGDLETYVEVSVELTNEIAAMLGCVYLVASEGFEHRVMFEFEMKQIRFMMSPHGDTHARCLQFDSPSIANFKAIREGSVVVQFRAETQTSITTVLDYVLNVGGALGVLKLEALQGDLFDESLVPAAAGPGKPKPMVTKGSKRVQ